MLKVTGEQRDVVEVTNGQGVQQNSQVGECNVAEPRNGDVGCGRTLR